MTDQEFIDAIWRVREEAKRRWGTDLVMKHSPEIGSETTVIPVNPKPWEPAVYTEIYTKEQEAKEIAANIGSGWVRERWLDILEPLLTEDEGAKAYLEATS